MINVRRIVLAVIFSVVIITAGIFTVSEKTEAKNTVNDFLKKDDLKDIVLEFKESKYTLIANDTIDIEINTNLSDKNARFSYGTDNSSAVISVQGNGAGGAKVSGNFIGTTVISVTAEVDYCNEEGLYEGTKTITKKAAAEVVGVSEYIIEEGETVQFEYHRYNAYKGMRYVLSDTAAFTITEKGLLTSVKAGSVLVYLEDGKGRKVYVGSVQANASGTYISETLVYRAVGSSPYLLSLVNLTRGNVEWSSSDKGIAKVDAGGFVTPVSAGEVTITASVKKSSGVVIKYKCEFHVTNPVLNITKTNIAQNASITLSLSGTQGSAVWMSSASDAVVVYSNGTVIPSSPSATVQALKMGNAVISVAVDGVIKTCEVTVTNPQLKKNFYVTAKGTKQIVNITGTNAQSNITYTSSNKKVATVNSSGVIKAKGTGYSAVTAHVDGAALTVSVNVGTKKGAKAVLNAMKAEGATYSQARRMSKGYYDCSSLVWRSYKPTGIVFGDRKYAPVAADEARFCVKHKKTVSKKARTKLNKLLPGDLFFFSGARNGRYKNIYHVAIYMGQESTSYYGSTYSFGRIIHASGTRVSQGYMYNIDNISVIGRPSK